MKKSLTQAIALATAIGASASAFAVNIDQDGHGSALLFPAYTVENGNSTYVSVTNTTDKFKAVKVRFVEGMNSAEVLDFNLYLSPQDVWSGMVVPTADGAKLVSNDTSCISANKDGFPAAGMAFRNFEYAGPKADAPAEFQGLDRARVGHFEVIEMGDIDPALVLNTGVTAGVAIKHVNGVPGSCAAINSAWNNGGTWKTLPSAGMNPGTGGLYGTAAIVNVDAGWASTYDATALANFAASQIHAEPGLVTPSLTQAAPEATFKEGTVAIPDSNRGIDAVSAVLMKEAIQNDYLIGAGLNAQTDMVVTFPTKRQYVNGIAVAGVRGFDAPFTAGWNMNTAKACEPVNVTYYDTEEGSLVLQDEQISPKPPAGEGLALCHETNILHISGSNLLGGEFVGHDLNLGAGFSQGWINVDFADVAARQIALEDAAPGDTVIKGLPAIGFSTVATQNGDVGGLLSNYAQSFAHKATTTLE